MNKDMPRSLVIGGAGFIGANLCRALLEEGHFVICIDNLSTGDVENLATIKSKNLVFRKMDILNTTADHVSSSLDYIFHLACPASPAHYQKDPLQTLNICFNGTWNVLEIARAAGARVIFASTSEVYGDPQESPQRESYWGHVNPHGPRSCYDEGKRVAESLVVNYGVQHGVNYGIVRIFNTYGPYMKETDGRVVSNFISQASRLQPITIYGKGSQTRSFCHIDDLVRGLIAMAKSAEKGPVNLGNPEEITIKQLADIVCEICDVPQNYEYRPLPEDDPCRRCPDITLAQRKLNWTPTISVREGIHALLMHTK